MSYEAIREGFLFGLLLLCFAGAVREMIWMATAPPTLAERLAGGNVLRGFSFRRFLYSPKNNAPRSDNRGALNS